MRYHFKSLMKHKVTVPPLWKDILLFYRDGLIFGVVAELVLIYSNSYDSLISKSVKKIL